MTEVYRNGTVLIRGPLDFHIIQVYYPWMEQETPM